MERTLTLRQEDYEAYRRHLLRQVRGRYDIAVWWGIQFFVGGMCLVAIWRTQLGFALGALLTSLIWVVWAGYVHQRRFVLLRRFVEELRSRGGPSLVVVGDEGVVVEGPHDRRFVGWRAVLEVVQTGDHVFLVLGLVEAVVVPRHAFGSDAEFLSFARQCAEYFEAKAVD